MKEKKIKNEACVNNLFYFIQLTNIFNFVPFPFSDTKHKINKQMNQIKAKP